MSGLPRLTASLKLALGLSVALLALRLSLVPSLGFGDAEALYASYALFPQAAYLDHPGLIGSLARLIGRGGAPSPEAAHLVCALGATLVPWLAGLAAYLAGAKADGATRSVLCLMLLPELSVGLFGLTPDLPLAVLWFVALGCALWLVRSRAPNATPKTELAVASLLGASLGLAILAKVSATLLALALLGASLDRSMRWVWRRPLPYMALFVCLLVVAPLMHHELSHGVPMLRHRLVATQQSSGFSLRNLGAFLGGQLLYVGPPFLWGGWLLARDLFKRHTDPASRLLWLALGVPMAVLALFSLWSARAEPHWVAPAYLALAVHAGRAPLFGRRLAWGALIYGGACALLVWLSVGTPLFVRLATSPSVERLFGPYRARYDLTNDLHAWGPGRELLRLSYQQSLQMGRQRPALVAGPHWMVCAQAQATLGHQSKVGCLTQLPNDFDTWYPRERWRSAPTILFVSDSRYPVDLRREFADYHLVQSFSTSVERAGIPVRTITVSRLDYNRGLANASLAPASTLGGSGLRPAAPTRSSSFFVSGLGVVNSWSP